MNEEFMQNIKKKKTNIHQQNINSLIFNVIVSFVESNRKLFSNFLFRFLIIFQFQFQWQNLLQFQFLK